jgi:hypothetical protein
MAKYWLGVVQREHVLRGVSGGFAQTNHGVKSGIQRMAPGDGLVYYSPKTSYPDGEPLREFTALGMVADADPWQAVEGDFRPWRRKIDYDRQASAAPITPLLDALELTRGNRNWGFIMRRGQVEISEHDFRLIAREMNATTLER